MMMKSSTSFGFSSSLVFFFFFIVASIAVYSEAASRVCLYRLIVQTGSVAEAGTDSGIGVTFVNYVGKSVDIPDLRKWGMMPPGHEYFKSGDQDSFLVKAPCITTPVCNITVTSDGGGQKPRWYLEYVTVFIVFRTNDLLSPQTETKFEFNQWLAIDEPPYELTASRDVCQSSTINKSINDF